MTKKIMILRHVDCEGPGYLLEVLDRNQLVYEIVKIDEGEQVPDSLDDCLALVSMGGGMSANDNLPWIPQEMALMRKAAAQKIPMLGHCLGAQLLAKALGADVFGNSIKEIGWFNVQKEKNETADFWLKDLPPEFEVFHWHGETFSLPDGATNILSSEHCKNQCFVLNNILAFQCHIEMTPELISEWTERFADQIDTEQETEQSPETMLQNLESRVQVLNKQADVIYQRWIDSFIA